MASTTSSMRGARATTAASPRSAAAAAVVAPMTTSGRAARAALPWRSTRARSAEGLAKVATSNGGGGGRSARATVCEAGTTSTAQPRARSALGQGVAAADGLGKQQARAGGQIAQRGEQAVLALDRSGTAGHPEAERLRGRARSRPPTAAIRGRARVAGGERRPASAAGEAERRWRW